jgi:hypothetical protein
VGEKLNAIVEKIKENQQLALLIGGGALVVIIVSVFFILKSKSAQQSTLQGPTASIAGQRYALGYGAAAAPGASGATQGAAAVQPTKPAVAVVAGAPEPIREDPFAPIITPGPITSPPPPPPPRIPVVWAPDRGIRFLPTSLQTVTRRRTAGLIWDGDVYGLLELGRNFFIVRPGDTVDKYEVRAITRDSIILYDQDLDIQIQVPLQGPSAGVSETISNPPVTAMPEYAPEETVPEAGTEESMPAMPDLPFE